MRCLPCRRSFCSVSSITTHNKFTAQAAVLPAILLATLTGLAQVRTSPAQSSPVQSAPNDQANPSGQVQPGNPNATITIPAGTRLALVLMQPIQSRHIHRGDDIYAQVTSPVNAGNEVVIPPGTFVDGKVDRLERHGGRGEVRLESMSISFPDGYVAPISGPMTLETDEGYAFKDPGPRRGVAAFAAPAAGAGIGALVGHSVGTSSSTVNGTLPPGCIGGPPFCVATTTPVFGTKGKDAIIGAGIGAAVGGIASMALLFGSHHFFLAAGSPVEMTLQHPVTLAQSEVSSAIRDSDQHPVPPPPILPPPISYPPFNTPGDIGPPPGPPSNPGTPPMVIPGAPGPGGVPGPPIVIPGSPPSL